LHLVSAWATKNRLSLGQIRTKNKSNEISGIKELLSLIDVKGSTITIDTMGCQREIAKQIKASGGDYVLAVKGNQGNLHTGLMRLFEQAKELNYNVMVFSKKETVDGDHGRIKTRNYTVLPLMGFLTYRDGL
jgi:predicted transposase YbfD/YdcC